MNVLFVLFVTLNSNNCPKLFVEFLSLKVGDCFVPLNITVTGDRYLPFFENEQFFRLYDPISLLIDSGHGISAVLPAGQYVL